MPWEARPGWPSGAHHDNLEEDRPPGTRHFTDEPTPMATARTIIDVSRPIFTGMAIYPRNPVVEIGAARRIARGDSSNVSLLTLGSHTGTHVDAPFHMDDAGAGVDHVSLDA